MPESLSSKTVFVLDHSHWMREGSGVTVEIDYGGQPPQGQGGRGNARPYFTTSFIPPVQKSLWTCAVETVLEYTRVITDLFANEKLLRFGLCQGQGNQGQLTWLNNWDVLSDGVQQQSVSFLAEKLGTCGPPPQALPHVKSSVSTVTGMQIGIKSAIEALSQPTPSQFAFSQSQGHGKSNLKAINKGRIICITSLTPQSVGKGSGEDLEDFFINALSQHNRMVAPSSDHLLPILECEFVLISIHPVGKEKFSVIQSRPKREVPPILNCETHVVDAEKIVQTMVELCVSHHDLISTIVTNIPMKEEQNAQHSSNYDVKLWHPRMAATTPETQVLKWSSPLTPKTSGGISLHHCTSAVRITPVDINGRPTTCLTSFLMNGRSVWLEVLKKSAGKTTSHLLTSHGGEMWLHVIETARNLLEDPPSISEGVGGRITDYRIPDFADLIRMNLIIPYPKTFYEHVLKKPDTRERDSSNPFLMRRRSSAEDFKKPIEMAKERLNKKTNFWPMTIGGSLLFPMSVHIDSLLRLMPLDNISDMDKVECDKCIWSLMSVEARGEPPISSGHNKKGHKRDDQWRAVYSELETFIRANQYSENHKKVLECFLESRRADSKIDNRSEDKANKQKTQDMEKALKSLAQFGTTTISITETDSPMSPQSPPPTPSTGKSLPDLNASSSSLSTSTSSTGEGKKSASLLALWSAKTEKKNLRVLTNTKLYSHLAQKGGDNTGDDDKTPLKTNGRKVIDGAKS